IDVRHPPIVLQFGQKPTVNLIQVRHSHPVRAIYLVREAPSGGNLLAAWPRLATILLCRHATMVRAVETFPTLSVFH
ncbi:MAG: hypothetical protein KGL54_08180, partial [Sphingomonadales bacterium]|nr:hypothetical protein [Sphingomonadales bacterium]